MIVSNARPPIRTPHGSGGLVVQAAARLRAISTLPPATPSHRFPRAFTLVELLVVVSIIALLISILLPSLRMAREGSKMVKCAGHMRGIGQAAMSFAAEKGGRMQLVSAQGGVTVSDPGGTRYAYGNQRELLSWPVALAQAAGVGYTNNWDWGVRAVTFAEAKAKEAKITEAFELMLCPSDRVRLSSPYYPRNEAGENGLMGSGDPEDPTAATEDMSYWGRLSFGINEDVAGYDGTPALCWRAALGPAGWVECKGALNYPPSTPCGRVDSGHRLRGNMDRIWDPSTVGLVFETGPESETQYQSMPNFDEFANLLITRATEGPYLGDSQQKYPSRIPTNRHPKGRMNVLFADLHADPVAPTAYSANNYLRRQLPSDYSPVVRVSPYQPHVTP